MSAPSVLTDDGNSDYGNWLGLILIKSGMPLENV